LGEIFDNFKEKIKNDYNRLKEDIKETVNHIREGISDAVLNKIDHFIYGFLEDISNKIHDDDSYYDYKNFASIKEATNDLKLKKFLERKVCWNDLKNPEIYKFIKKLPKIDLHCHLGGCARKPDIFKIAETYPPFQELIQIIQSFFMKKSKEDLEILFQNKPVDVVQAIYTTANINNLKAVHYANIIQYLAKNNLKGLLDSVYKIKDKSGNAHDLIKNEQSTKWFSNLGLKKYLSLGDWAGSTLLQTKEAIEKAIECLCSYGKEHNLRYLELRFNPLSYSREKLTPEDVYKFINNSIQKFRKDIIINIIFCVGKPKGAENLELREFKKDLIEIVTLIEEIIQSEEDSKGEFRPRLVGFDIAGLEDYFHEDIRYGASDIIASTRDEIISLFSKKIFISIHCGETQIYKSSMIGGKKKKFNVFINSLIQLGADRLGHALDIPEQLFHKIKRKNITIELCPSSNCHTGLFLKTPWLVLDKFKDDITVKSLEVNQLKYPLSKYLNSDLNVTINTDDPAFSKTDWTKELFLASELSIHQLDLIKIIKLIYNGLKGAFILESEKKKLELRFNQEIKSTLEELSI